VYTRQVVGRPLDEKDLVEQAKRGDGAAYGALIRMHQEIAFRTAYALLRDATEAEEAVQDTVVKAYKALGRLRSTARFRTWLLLGSPTGRLRRVSPEGAVTSVRLRRP
jgi:RNA polymerase sigma-70 factor, ECF subfamily